MDWNSALESLGALRSSLPEGADTPPAAPGKPAAKDSLAIFTERKGRGGKTATIITGFTVSPDQLSEIASRLKQTLGCGGSARDGEILLQGERRADAAQTLRSLGFKVKG